MNGRDKPGPSRVKLYVEKPSQGVQKTGGCSSRTGENVGDNAASVGPAPVLATIGLTVPSIIVVSRWTGLEIVLGVEHTDLVMLALTLFLCVVTFGSGRTNVIQGAVHVVLFAVYLALIVQA